MSLSNTSNFNLEDYPHVVKRVVSTWCTPAFEPMMDGMLLEANRFDRQGWPDDAFRELLLLRDIHRERFPHLIPKVDPWDVKGVGISK